MEVTGWVIISPAAFSSDYRFPKTLSSRMTTYLVVGIIVLVALIAVAVSVIGRARRFAVQEHAPMEDELAEFERMRDDGQISEEEYQKLKKVYSQQAVQRFKNS